ncbi:MAG: hypothetical protein ACK42L_02720, partial [Thermoanaerobaculum sp.]
MGALSDRRLWVWRALGVVLLSGLVVLLLGLAGKVRQLEGRAWDKTMGELKARAMTLPSPLREELLAAFVCLKLQREGGLLNARRSGAFMRAAREALSDGQ